MEPSIIFFVIAVSTITTDYSTTKLEWTPDIRTECLCWAVLCLGLRFRRYKSKMLATESEDAPSLPTHGSEFTWMAWSISFFVAVTRVLPVYYDITPVMPLTVVSTFLALSYRDLRLDALPKPGVSKGGLTPKLQRRRSIQSFLLGLLGICSLFYMSRSVNAPSVLILVLFIVARSSSFFLLDTFMERSEDLSLWEMLETIAFRVFCILVGVLIIFPSSSTLVWSMILHAFCISAGLTATFYLVCGIFSSTAQDYVLCGYTLATTTIEPYSISAIQSLVAITAQDYLIFLLISVTSLALGITYLPTSATRQKIFALMIIPMLPILTGHSALWRLEPSLPWDILDPSVHPIRHLAIQAETKFHTMVKKQSQTLNASCAEYERRYGRQPPLHFDRWFRAAQDQGFLLTDEFDTMMAAIEPLWGVAPSDIRARVDNAISASQGTIIQLKVVQGRSIKSAHWMGSVINNWFDPEILETIPDMTLAINTMDEPKVVVPHDILSHALEAARGSRQGTLLPGKNSDLAQHVDFLDISKQDTWDAMSLSCPPDTPARDFYQEAIHSPALTEIGFLSNLTLSKDVCQFPELHNIHAGLRHPSSMSMTHALVPIFSQAKASCFNDLLYPSPFYAAKLSSGEYHEGEDIDWDQKENVVYWTGSNTGGSPRTRTGDLSNGNRQDGRNSVWVPINSTIAAISNSTQVRISAAIQCEHSACMEQEKELDIKAGERDAIAASYKARYNLDLDGNGLSGRFYRLLMSKSAVLKQTLYQEWHDDWLVPWVHYIPLSMDLRDFPEIVRYLTQEREGQALGRKVAQNSYEWSRRVLRNKDMKMVWWRLMLEYGRLLSDDRDQLWCKNCTNDHEPEPKNI
ncbi:hypothetical protein N7510_007539 [Penicillium lagena]|uniref:uncharacterized protein n=1 Tax=Penicillium lagena TaxID=94218 RepID=UPI0025416E08|nr:uncharacterized protein N7510_007539 [Penicillium lagena]KAJ5610820.1 hypothetical protein N7510_007539 [Penicillium lagena]